MPRTPTLNAPKRPERLIPAVIAVIAAMAVLLAPSQALVYASPS